MVLQPKLIIKFMSVQVILYCIMGKIVPEGNINKSKTYLLTGGEAEGLINGSRWMFICPRDDLAMLYIILYFDCEINFGPRLHK